jgi:OOP family OmpA-OmpF porin
MLLKTFVGALVGSTLALAGVAHADTGPYIGASLGETTFKDSEGIPDGLGGTTHVHLDENDTSYKLYGGYMILPFLGLEGGYVDFGDVSKNFSGTGAKLDLSADGWEAYLVGNLPLGPVDRFLKGGVLSYNADLKARVNGATVASGSDSDQVGAYGFGAAVGLGGFKIRAEYTMYDISNIDDLYMISAGVTYHF